MMNPVEILQHVTSHSEEIDALDQLKKSLSPTDDDFGEDDIERQWLSLASESLGEDGPCNPFPAYTPDGLLSSQSDLDRFTCYLFERRFSWSEETNKGNFWMSQKGLDPLLQPTYKSSTERDAVLKGRLNNLLDDFLKWYLCQEVSQPLLKSLRFTFTQARHMPVVRNQTMIHVMEWLQLHASHPSFHEHFVDAEALVMCGLCDVWSAVRNACVARLGRFASNLTLQELESLFNELAKICLNQDSSWQCVEGALMAINLLLKCFQWIGVLPLEEDVSTSTSRGQYYLKFGEQELTHLPEFISSCIHSVLYPLLAHAQLGVRDNATKAFSTYLSRCDFKIAVESLQEAVFKLSQDEDIGRFTTLSSTDYFSVSPPGVLQQGYTFMAACEAEGLLNVCLYLIKHVHSGVLLLNWPKYFSTFSLYLMHPASTVRQAASVIFKYIVAKESNNPGLLKLVLQALCANWSIDITDEHLKKCSSQHYHTTIKHEGRQNDGQVSSHKTLQRQFSREQEKQRSISTLSGIKEGDFKDDYFCQAWEWREGRLFAYELIVKFLIINHIHYLFPSYALLPPKFDGSVSADDAVTRSHQPHSPKRPTFSKSFSHGITTRFQIHDGDGAKEDSTRERSLSSTSQTLPSVSQQGLTRSGSERRKNMLEEKRSRTLAEGTIFKKQFSKHHSYFTNQSTPRGRGRSSDNIATSLLCQVRNTDALSKDHKEHLQHEKLLIPFPVTLQGPAQSSTLTPNVKLLFHSALSAAKILGRKDTPDVDWLQHVELQKMSTLLRQILLQTICCLADGRWEVRRMAQQALPLITECIRWYDMSVLTSLWNDYLHPKESVVSYGLAVTLAVSVQHVVRLVHFIDAPTVSWKDPEICHGITLPIITALSEGLSNWCGVALSLLDRTTVDKLTVVILEIIMTTHTYFPDLLCERYQYEMAVVRRILQVFRHAHPQHRTSQQNTSEESYKFDTPVDGFLCCCYKAEYIESLACQVEKYLLTELQQFIPAFLQSCSVQGAIRLLPPLLHMVGHYSQDSHLMKCLLGGCMNVGNKIANWREQCHGEVHEEEKLIQYTNGAVEEMTALVSDKELEMTTFKQVLDLFFIISAFVKIEQLTVILSAISLRFDLSCNLDLGSATNKSSQGKEDTRGLVYLSNNIPASHTNNEDSSDEDEADEKIGTNHAAESLSLSVSGGSGQMLWPVHIASEHDQLAHATHNNQDETDSDWDSWDEEQEDQASLYCVVSQFFKRFQESHNSTQHGGQLPLILAIRQLDEKKRNFFSQLLNPE